MLNWIKNRIDDNHTSANVTASRLSQTHGFTLIELLVVILIIGILAAIAIPSFLNQRQKGQDACAKSMARTMQTGIETYFIDNNTYVGASGASLSGIENQITGGKCGAVSTVITGASGAAGLCTGVPAVSSYCVAATSASGNSFAVQRAANGAISRTCGAAPAPAPTGGGPGTGGCVAGGTW